MKLDPDTSYLSRDKIEHAVTVGVTALVLSVTFLHFSWWQVLLISLIAAVSFELGQADATPAEKEGISGYGFGLLDIAAGMVGAIIVVGFFALLRLIF